MGYITEKKADFPENITMNINGWLGTTSDGANYNQLCADYDNYVSYCCNKEVVNATTKAPRNWMIASISLGIFALVMLFVVLPLGIMPMVGAGACAIMMIKSKKDMNAKIAKVNQKYTDMSIQGKNKIAACIDQWNKTKSIVNLFHSEPIRDIIA